ncbi:MAG: hypothetical protein R3Y32_07105 [Bacillota bacterium]
MKKIISLSIFICFFCFGFTFQNEKLAFGAEIYGRAETSTVGFYASELETTPMFYLPIGYYVVITGETDDFYSCEYAKTESSYVKKYGFVKKDEIYIDSDMALPLFPEVTITAIKDTNLYSKQNKSTVVSNITAGQKAYFYGLYTDGDTALYYVKISDDFGYVDTAGFEQLSIPTHPKLLSFADTYYIETSETVEGVDGEVTAETESESDSESESLLSFDIQIAMILCIAVPALIFMFYAFAPSEKGVSKYFDS